MNINETTYEYDGDSTDFDVLKGGMSMYPYKLYENESPSMFNFDNEDFTAKSYRNYTETKFFAPAQIQLIEPSFYSDNEWIASREAR